MSNEAKAALEKVMADLPPPKRKAGWKTSEFWLTIATSAAALLAGVQGILPPQYAAIAMAVSNGIYAIARGLAKS